MLAALILSLDYRSSSFQGITAYMCAALTCYSHEGMKHLAVGKDEGVYMKPRGRVQWISESVNVWIYHT